MVSGKKKSSDLLQAKIRKAALLAYSANFRDSEIAEEMAVSLSTVRGWKVRPEWADALGEIGALHWSRSINQLRAATLKAVAVAEQLLDDKDPSVRLRAARMILDRGLVFQI